MKQINGSTALHICAAKNELACLQILVEHGADIEKQGRFSTIGTPLHVACTYGNAHAVNLLINLGADKNSREPTGHTPMHFACKSGHYDVAFMLIELEVDLQLRAENNKVAFDYVEVPTIKEKMLIAAGVVNARIEARLEAERVAAAAEAERRRKEQERLDLLRREEEERMRQAILRKAAFTKALRSVADISGELSALLGVAEEYPDQDINVNIIQPLTEYADESFFFAKENEYDMDSLTGTVHSHTTVGTSYAVYQLINSLSDSSALTRASLRGFHEVVHALLQWPGVNINYQDSNGNTALHNAALIGNRDIVEMLLTAGIKLTTLNHAGKVAANLAKTNYLRELIRNPALLAHQRRYQDGVLDHIFLQRKCRDGLSLTLDEARSVDRFLEYDQNIASGEQEMKVVLRESVVNTAAHLALENVSDSPSRSKSKYFKGQNNKNKHMELQSNIHTANKTTDHHHLHSILKHPESNISVPPLLMFTPDKVPPELSHLFPHSSSMIVPAHAISSLPVPAAGATDSSSKGLAAVQQLESAVADKYGPVPGAFGGSQSDFFFRSPLYATHVHHVQNNQAEHGSGVISAAGPLFLDLLTLQRGYLPTAFDTTEEWNEIKDFLWLLGYNHKPSPQKLSEHHSLQADSLVETSGHHLDSTWSQLTTAVAPDKRYYLFRLAVVMNRIQGAFTDEDGQLANSKNAHAVSAESSIEFDIDFESVGNAPERLPAIPSAQSSPQKSRRNKQSAMPPISSPVAEIKRALSAEAHKYSDTELTAGQGNKQQTHPQKEGAEAELDIDWSRIPANICRPDVYRLVRFAKLCEQFVLLVLRLYEPRDDGWPNPMTDQAGGYITQSLRYNVAYMRYYGFVTTEVEELLLNLVDLGYTACFQDPPSQQEDETSSHRRKVGFAEENTYQPVSITQSASSQSKRRNSKKAPIKQERRVPNLFLNPPRYWRLAVDSVFEVVAFIKAKAEHGYPLDAVRAHLWAHTGRLLIQQQRNLFLLKSHQRHQQQHQLEVEIGGNPSATAAPFPSTQVSSAHCTPAKPAALTTMGGDVYVSSSSTAGAAAQQLGFRRWLSDLFLSDYEAYFQHQGFRCLADFEGLTEQDCTEYFPFLKV